MILKCDIKDYIKVYINASVNLRKNRKFRTRSLVSLIVLVAIQVIPTIRSGIVSYGYGLNQAYTGDFIKTIVHSIVITIVGYAVAIIFSTIVLGIITVGNWIAGDKQFAKNAEQLSHQISKVRTIICQGQVKYQQSERKIIAGWMFLTEDAVEFYCVEGNDKEDNTAILLDDIISTATKPNNITIITAQETYLFGVAKSDIWKEQIDKAVAG